MEFQVRCGGLKAVDTPAIPTNEVLAQRKGFHGWAGSVSSRGGETYNYACHMWLATAGRVPLPTARATRTQNTEQWDTLLWTRWWWLRGGGVAEAPTNLCNSTKKKLHIYKNKKKKWKRKLPVKTATSWVKRLSFHPFKKRKQLLQSSVHFSPVGKRKLLKTKDLFWQWFGAIFMSVLGHECKNCSILWFNWKGVGPIRLVLSSSHLCVTTVVIYRPQWNLYHLSPAKPVLLPVIAIRFDNSSRWQFAFGHQT